MRLNQIHQAHQDRVAFLLIYIREAHPADGWQTPQNLHDEVIFTAPATDDHRAKIAGACQVALDIRLPMVLDGIDNAIEEAYVAKPIRLFVIDRDGIVAYTGAPGPAGFDPDGWERAIRAAIASG